jgi:serine/threonine protein kinase
MNASLQCLTEEELIAYLSGELLSAEKTTHIQDCRQCQKTSEQIRSDLDAIRAVVASSNGRGLEFSKSEFLAHSWDATRDAKPDARIVSASPDGRLPIGVHVGNYTVIRLLGRGGQSEAYLVRQSDKGEDSPRFVLKVTRLTDARGLPLSSSQRQQSYAALRQEEQMLYKFQGIAGTLQYIIAGTIELEPGEPEPYLVTDYLKGQTLQQRASEFSSPEKAVALVIAIAEIMRHVHQTGVVHGDLKPQNIILSDGNSPTVIDFGLARVRDVWNSGDESERQGGTIQFMATEQATGDYERIGPATDVFALGAILQQLITRKKLYAGDDWKACLRAAQAGQISLASAQEFGKRAVYQVASRCLETNPERRYANGGALADELRGIRFKTKSPWIVAAAGVAIALVSWVIWTVYFTQTEIVALPPIPGLLGGNGPIGNWHEKLPVLVDERVRADAEGPNNSLWFLVWIDGARSVSVYSEQSPKYPILTQTLDDQNSERIVWPDFEKTISITGDGGTELIMLVGFSAGERVSEQDIQQRVEAAISSPDSWPELPNDILFRFDKSRVQDVPQSGTPRGPGEVQPSSYLRVEATINSIRKSLGEQVQFLRGEAFRVTKLE